MFQNGNITKSRLTNSNKSTNGPTQQFYDPPEPQLDLNDNGGTEEEIDWDDPDLLNNPEKLMKLKFDDDLIQAATSTTLADSMHYQTELFLQDKSIMKMLKEYRSRKQKNLNKDDQPLIARIESILAKIDREQEAGVRIYLETKNKPFWDPRNKQDILLSEDQKANVKRWVNILDEFSSSFQAATSLRYRRSSIAPKSSSDPEAEQLVEQLRQINQELTKASEIFDMILK